MKSTDSNVVYVPGLKANDLYVVIANDDNPPLFVREVRAYQLTTYVLANLTAASTYQLHFSAADVSAPIYDQTPFNATLPANLPITNVSAVHTISPANAQSASFFTDRRIIWPALGFVLLVLGLLSYRLFREMGRSNG